VEILLDASGGCEWDSAAVDDYPLGPAMPLQSFTQEALGNRQIPPPTKPELNRIAVAIDRAIEIHPVPAEFDVCLVQMPLSGDSTLAAIEPLQQFGGVLDDPSVNGRVIQRDTTLGHHLSQVPDARAVIEILPGTAGSPSCRNGGL
jgi:hypothetical protein